MKDELKLIYDDDIKILTTPAEYIRQAKVNIFATRLILNKSYCCVPL